MLAVHFSVEFLGLVIIARETLSRVRDVDTTINGSLHGSEDTGASGGTGKPGVEASAEGSGAIGGVFNHEVVSVDLGLALIKAVQVQLFEDLETKVILFFNNIVSNNFVFQKMQNFYSELHFHL
jgi:hypothetical protein